MASKAFVIVHDNPQNTWFYDVATNYTKLNFDYCMADRFIENSDWDFYETNKLNLNNYNNYEFIIVTKPGVIFPYSYFQRVIEPHISDAEYYKFPNTELVHIWCPKGYGVKELDIKYTFPYVDPTNANTFSATHDSAIDILLRNSNLAYVVHNETPKPVELKKPVQWAMTVSSGFYINYILEDAGFDSKTIVNHVDISKSSLAVRRYTIENWDGKDYLKWLDHLYEKFPLLDIFNSGQFKRGHRPTHQVLEHMEYKWGNSWEQHWKKYQECDHYYNICNFGDVNAFNKILQEHDVYETSVFWYNGALKRQPANVNKTSRQSHANAKRFMKAIADYNPNLLVYGSDHCCKQFNGVKATTALEAMEEDSRETLWRREHE